MAPLDEDVPNPANAAGLDVAFEDVPAADPSAELDPQFATVHGSAGLPLAYLPPAMPGRRSPRIKAVAMGLIAVFVGATAAGVCLTYGPPVLGL